MKIVKRILLVLLSLFFTIVYSNAQTDNLTLKIENVLKAKNARIGVAIFNSNEKDTLKLPFPDAKRYEISDCFSRFV